MKRIVAGLVLVAAATGACGGGGPSKSEIASSVASASGAKSDAGSASKRNSGVNSNVESRKESMSDSEAQAVDSAELAESSWESSKSLSAVAVVGRLVPAYKEARAWIAEHQSNASLRVASPALKQGLDNMVKVIGEVSKGLGARVDEPGYREALVAWAFIPAAAAEASTFCEGTTGQTLCDKLLNEFFEDANTAISATNKLGLLLDAEEKHL